LAVSLVLAWAWASARSLAWARVWERAAATGVPLGPRSVLGLALKLERKLEGALVVHLVLHWVLTMASALGEGLAAALEEDSVSCWAQVTAQM